MKWTNKPNTKRNKNIVKLYDSKGSKKKDFVQIGKKYGITKQRAGQIYKREKRKEK